MCPLADEPAASAPHGAAPVDGERRRASGAKKTSAAGSAHSPPVRRHRLSVVGVLGELLITAGALVLLFLGWQLWWNDMMMANAQSDAASAISQEWLENIPVVTPPPGPDNTANPQSTPEPDAKPAPVDHGSPVVARAPASGQAFAVMYVPRFGAQYHRSIAEGTGHDVLNSNRLGIGHYANTQMPGEVGNFAVAAHRSAFGGAMHLINEFQLGDAVYVQTADGYYTYRYRDTEYVAPSQVQVLASVPNQPQSAATESMITLTSCNPLYSTAERIIAYGVLESWQPLSAGPPAELAPIIAAQG